MPKTTKEQEHCSFCGAPKAKTEMLVSGLEALICEKCIEQAEHIRAEALGPKNGTHEASKADYNQFNLLKPAEIKSFLDEYIIGQDDAKKSLAVAVYNHYKRLKYEQSGLKKGGDFVEIE
eukprot:gene2478-3222_t